jgi:RimJ/RimL family protein N-acetyltransferase
VTGSSVEIRGPRLLLRALRDSEIDEQWRAMVEADPMAIATLPDESDFRARLGRSGRLADGELDLATDLDGTLLGRIQTFVPPGRPLPPGTFDLGIGLREHARGQGHGREAIALLAGWLFEQAAAQVVEGITDPANTAMRGDQITLSGSLFAARYPGEPGTGLAAEVPGRELPAAHEERQILG